VAVVNFVPSGLLWTWALGNRKLRDFRRFRVVKSSNATEEGCKSPARGAFVHKKYSGMDDGFDWTGGAVMQGTREETVAILGFWTETHPQPTYTILKVLSSSRQGVNIWAQIMRGRRPRDWYRMGTSCCPCRVVGLDGTDQLYGHDGRVLLRKSFVNKSREWTTGIFRAVLEHWRHVTARRLGSSTLLPRRWRVPTGGLRPLSFDDAGAVGQLSGMVSRSKVCTSVLGPRGATMIVVV